MIKKLLILCFALLFIQTAHAQQTYADAKREFKSEYRAAHRYDPVSHSFSFQYSQRPYFSKNNFNGYTLKQLTNALEARKGSLSYVYGDYTGNTKTTGTIFGEYNMIFSSGCAFSCDLGMSVFWKERYNGISGEKVQSKTGVAIYVVPKFKYFYLTRKNIRLYGDLGLGAGVFFGFASRLRPAFQINPFGLEVGSEKLYGTFEIGAGSLFTGGSVGIGYKL